MADAVPKGWDTFRYAAVLDRFHLSPGELARLTDYQINRLLFHPRTKDGGLVEPKGADRPPPEVTDETRLQGIAQLEACGLITRQRADELREEVRRRGEESQP